MIVGARRELHYHVDMATEFVPGARATARDHGFHTLRVSKTVRETAEACSFVLEVPAHMREAYAYEAGQFCNVRVHIGDRSHVRCYSMSSAPEVDEEMQVTVKRVRGGLVSNWLIDHLCPGDPVEVGLPTGLFRLTPVRGDLVAFAAGSGITPVFSLLKEALATTDRRVRLLYANRDRDSTIFGDELGVLQEEHGDRLTVMHHLDAEEGFVDSTTVRAFLGAGQDAEHYICGPGPFMQIIEEALLEAGVDTRRLHIERFTPTLPLVVDSPADASAPKATRVTIELEGRIGTTDHRPGTTVLQTARQMGMSPPYSCESGVCATCMARVREGSVSMYVNNALTTDEVADGWVLTCQSLPTSESLHVVYEQ